MATAKKLLNVGGGSKSIPLPEQLQSFEHVLLDVDPSGNPDIILDARELDTLEPNQFDAIYCSHNLEHFHFHEVPIVLRGMLHVLKPGGFTFIRVPDILAAIDRMRAGHLDFEEGLYEASGTPIMTLDVIYGWSVMIQRGHPHYAHKTAFTESMLRRRLTEAGFEVGDFQASDLEFRIVGYKPKGV